MELKGFLTITCLVVISSILSRTCCGADKSRKVSVCAHKCATCYSTTLHRMGCIETCEDRKDYDSFTCSRDPVDSVTKDALRKELDKMNGMRGQYQTDRNFDGIRTMYTDDAMYFADKLKPGIGIEGLVQGMKDWLDSNYINKAVFVGDTDSHDYGEDKSAGIVWDNGEARVYDDEGGLIGTFRFVFLYKRIDGELKEYIDILGV